MSNTQGRWVPEGPPSALDLLTATTLTVPDAQNVNSAFTVSLSFTGNPGNSTWLLMQAGLGSMAKVQFIAEPVGPGAVVDVSLGPVASTAITTGFGNSYTINLNVPAATLTAGIYEISAVLTFFNAAGSTQILSTAAFAGDAFIQIYT